MSTGHLQRTSRVTHIRASIQACLISPKLTWGNAHGAGEMHFIRGNAFGDFLNSLAQTLVTAFSREQVTCRSEPQSGPETMNPAH